MTLVCFEVENFDVLQALLPLRQHQVISKKVDVLYLHFRAVSNELLPSRLSRIGNSRGDHAKVFSSLVCPDITEGAAMIDVIFMIGLTRANEFQLGRRCRSRQVAPLLGSLTLRANEDDGPVPRAVSGDVE